MVEPGIEPGTIMISSQRPLPLDHEAGHAQNVSIDICIIISH